MSKVHDQARQLVSQSGARVTSARVAVLAALLQAGAALTHHELQTRLEAAEPDRDGGPGDGPCEATDDGAAAEARSTTGPGLDRVTLYRVLEWLVDVGLAHRVPDPDRVLRFSAQPAGAVSAQHGHFRCQVCHGVFCLADGPGTPGAPEWLAGMLPAGFAGEHLELTVTGRCARCSGI